MVVKANDKLKGGFIGIPFDLLTFGKSTIVNKINYRAGDLIPEHSHPQEQSGYVLSGIYLLRLDEVDEILIKGDFYSVPANAEHSLEVLEAGEILEIPDSVHFDFS
jgi:quercetin dioxygenase-like cupin family protein